MAKKTSGSIDVNALVKKTGSSSLAMVIIATVIVVFCLVSARALLVQGAYQRRVVNAKHETVKQLKSNIEKAKNLSVAYRSFADRSPNFLGGNGNAPDNAFPPDGPNSRLVLDALPSNYDFPALVASLDSLVRVHRLTEPEVKATDSSLPDANGATTGSAQSTAQKAGSSPVTISDLVLGGKSDSSNIFLLLTSIERSIRPMNVTKLDLTKDEQSSQYTTTVTLETYYQPSKKVEVKDKLVK